jgi:hypothetical protein
VTITWLLVTGGGGNGNLLFHGYRVSIILDGYSLEICGATQFL